MTKKKDIDHDSLVLTQTKPKTKKPSMYKGSWYRWGFKND